MATVETVDDLILELKPNGTFQILLTIAVCVLNAPAVISLWLTEFTATDVSWQCNDNRYTLLPLIFGRGWPKIRGAEKV